MTSGGGSGRDREDVVGGIGAVGNGKWMSPYALYALDWCKWPVSNGGYGRVAMCSYAEDSHNYVSFVLPHCGVWGGGGGEASAVRFFFWGRSSSESPDWLAMGSVLPGL